MLFVCIALWLTAALLLMTNRRKSSGRWLSLVAFCGGAGALAAVIGDDLRPYLLLQGHEQVQRADALLAIVQRICSWTSYYGLPLAFLRFAAAYHPEALPAWLRGRQLHLTLLPPLLMIALPPLTEEFPVRYPVMAIWALPYFAAGALLLLLKRVHHRNAWQSHLILMAAVLPAVLFACAMNYVLPLFGIYGMWRYNIWPIAAGFTIFLGSLFTFGFLGVKLLIERKQLDTSIRMITSGTAILNHAIKNDLGKMKLFGEKINRYALKTDNVELQQDIQVMLKASEHIEQMIRKVHERTQELLLTPERLSLPGLLQECLQELAPMLEGRIRISTQLDEAAITIADRAQTKEAIQNVLKNALDAMPQQGELHVSVKTARKVCIVEIRDTGIGIAKEHLRRVFEPFYTTKSGQSLNFGLGLAYCYQLMKRQGGSMSIASEQGRGTAVVFHFPKAS